MSWSNGKKEGFKKCRSATFSIDGFSFTIGRKHLFTICVSVCCVLCRGWLELFAAAEGGVVVHFEKLCSVFMGRRIPHLLLSQLMLSWWYCCGLEYFTLAAPQDKVLYAHRSRIYAVCHGWINFCLEGPSMIWQQLPPPSGSHGACGWQREERQRRVRNWGW